MNQPDLFTTEPTEFLYGEIQKLNRSLERRSRAIFALLHELQNEFLNLKQSQDSEGK
jgi:hypothetical protein